MERGKSGYKVTVTAGFTWKEQFPQAEGWERTVVGY